MCSLDPRRGDRAKTRQSGVTAVPQTCSRRLPGAPENRNLAQTPESMPPLTPRRPPTNNPAANATSPRATYHTAHNAETPETLPAQVQGPRGTEAQTRTRPGCEADANTHGPHGGNRRLTATPRETRFGGQTREVRDCACARTAVPGLRERTGNAGTPQVTQAADSPHPYSCPERPPRGELQPATPRPSCSEPTPWPLAPRGGLGTELVATRTRSSTRPRHQVKWPSRPRRDSVDGTRTTTSEPTAVVSHRQARAHGLRVPRRTPELRGHGAALGTPGPG